MDMLCAVAEMFPTCEVGPRGRLRIVLRGGAETSEPHETMDIGDIDPTSVALHAAALMVGQPIKLKIQEGRGGGTYEVIFPASPLRLGEGGAIVSGKVQVSKLTLGLAQPWQGLSLTGQRDQHNNIQFMSHIYKIASHAGHSDSTRIPKRQGQKDSGGIKDSGGMRAVDLLSDDGACPP